MAENMGEDWVVIVAVIGIAILGLFLLLLALGVAIHAFAVAISLLAWAAEHGFVGVALYVIPWVIAAPLMLTICLIGGAVRLMTAEGQ